MIRDIGNNEARFNAWLDDVKQGGIIGLSPTNSKLIINHIEDMLAGTNTNRKHSKGKRGFNTLLTRKTYLVLIFKNLESRGIKNIGNIKEKQIQKYFDDVKTGVVKNKSGGKYGTSIIDQVKAFRAFWNWYIKINRKKGKIIPDVTEDLSADKNGENFVYFTLDHLKQILPYFSADEQVRLLFMFDTIIRSPKELMNVKVSDLHDDFQQLSIRDETSKTYGRTIKLLLCSDELRKYVENNKLNPDDYLFNFDPSMFNRKLKQVMSKVLGTTITKGGKPYSEIRMYDFRHSGAIHWRLGAYKSKIDALMYRGGWSSLEILNYYTKKIGMKDSIEKSDLLIEVDKNEIQKQKLEMDKLNRTIELLTQDNQNIKETLLDLTKTTREIVEESIRIILKEKGLSHLTIPQVRKMYSKGVKN